MPEKWELLQIVGNLLYIYTPNGWQVIGIEDYIKIKGKKYKYEERHHDVIPCLLSEGWEPFAQDFFRKKIIT